MKKEEISIAKTALEEKLSTLEEQAKSLKALQDAWNEKESNLNSRLADLDTETKEARKLKSELSVATTEILEQRNKVALAEQKASAGKETLTDIKIRLQNKDKALEQLRADVQQAKETANQQVVTLTQEHAEEKGSMTAKIGFLAQKITDLESQLAEKKKSPVSK